jgi:hypothetical protein
MFGLNYPYQSDGEFTRDSASSSIVIDTAQTPITTTTTIMHLSILYVRWTLYPPPSGLVMVCSVTHPKLEISWFYPLAEPTMVSLIHLTPCEDANV